MDEAYEFDAFISYSHRDMAWGRRLQNTLERWRMPAALRREEGLPQMRLRVFRDQTDLAGVELQESIQRELERARYLIVICSPNSAASPWVAAEIAYYKQLGRAQNILPFIVEGEPETDRPELECFSPELRNDPDRHYLGANVNELGARKACLRLISILTGVRFNRLVDRDRRQRILRASLIGALACIAVGVTSLLLWRNWKTENEKRLLLYSNAVTAYAKADEVTPEMIGMLKLSADAGEAQACLLLGDIYENGRGTAPDAAEAFRRYQQAAALGSTDALAAVARCYMTGSGIEADAQKAFQYYERAAEQGNLSGMFGAALCCRDGEGTTQDEAKAFTLFKQAAEQGHSLSMNAVAFCYMAGSGTEKDPERAFEWTEKLAETGDADGMYNLGMMYQNGYGTAEDPQKALYWYRRAAEQGDAAAMYMVGWCLENRYGSSDPALDWYTRAAENGYEQAAEAVRRLG